MIRFSNTSLAIWRRVGLTLAALAIVLKVAIPGGFMASAPTNGLPFALVICTGQGAMTVAPGVSLPGQPDQKAPVDKSSHNAPCAFAGHGVGTTAPNLVESSPIEFVAYRLPAARPLINLAPGRGLAAPPLPARGPPTVLI